MGDITLTTVTDFTTMECTCGITYALTDEFIAYRRKDHRTFYCPNGCHRHYPQKNEAEKLQDKLTAERARLDQEKAKAAELRRQLTAAKSEATKAKNRAAKGVCPCCNRSFVNVARHMAGQHPEFPSS